MGIWRRPVPGTQLRSPCCYCYCSFIQILGHKINGPYLSFQCKQRFLRLPQALLGSFSQSNSSFKSFTQWVISVWESNQGYFKHMPASGPLHLLFPPVGVLFLQIATWPSLYSRLCSNFTSREALPDSPVYSGCPPPITHYTLNMLCFTSFTTSSYNLLWGLLICGLSTIVRMSVSYEKENCLFLRSIRSAYHVACWMNEWMEGLHSFWSSKFAISVLVQWGHFTETLTSASYLRQGSQVIVAFSCLRHCHASQMPSR